MITMAKWLNEEQYLGSSLCLPAILETHNEILSRKKIIGSHVDKPSIWLAEMSIPGPHNVSQSLPSNFEELTRSGLHAGFPFQAGQDIDAGLVSWTRGKTFPYAPRTGCERVMQYAYMCICTAQLIQGGDPYAGIIDM